MVIFHGYVSHNQMPYISWAYFDGQLVAENQAGPGLGPFPRCFSFLCQETEKGSNGEEDRFPFDDLLMLKVK
jgi:hypothetical protein